MNELYIGASGLPQRWSDCFRHLSVLEVVESGYQVLRRKTVKRWRTDAPEGFEFVLALDQRISHPHEMTREMMSDAQREAPSLLGSFQTNDQVMAIWGALLELAEILGTTKILVQPPAQFAPSPLNVERLGAFANAVRRDGLTLIWQAGGMWDGDTVVELCRQWGMVPAIDPFLSSEPLALEAFPFVYYRLAGRGATLRRFSPSHFDVLVSEHLSQTPAYLIFGNQNRWHDAKRFTKFLRQFDDES